MNKEENVKKWQNLKWNFKISVFEMCLMGIILGAHLTFDFISRFTIAKLLPINIEIIFAIIYGLIFSYFKGALLAFLADTLIILITGQIGTWYWMYAIIPPLIAILSALILKLFKINRTTGVIFSYIVFFITIASVIYFIIDRFNEGKTISLNRTYFSTNTSLILVIIFVSLYGLIGLIVNSIFLVLYKKTKREFYMNYFIIFTLVSITIVLFRWIFGSYTWINYYNYFFRNTEKFKLKTVGTDFKITLFPILIRSTIPLPFYIYLLSPLYNVLEILKKKYMVDPRIVKW
ncbi:hypothetical protein [Mycoplasma sp. 1018B]|uniref:hypothetical protein n=1 Tax=Mycoplasma sp. 1018B TaxID=2967302 RepID=UPI00211CB82E|nr:hypothetical protein [Mycoplasma sp. 1018B]UUM18968.1 hypothetical protein NPA14_01335 [Mycoplasma sp. 1018B]